MATIASQVLFHPVVSRSLTLGSTTLGRDKLYRAAQYFSRFLAWYYLNRGDKLNAARWASLKAHLGTARKLIRLGKPIEHLQAALRASATTGPAAERITTIGRQLAYFGFLSYDALVWANAVKVLNLSPETAQKVAKVSNRFWLAGILLSIINSVLKSSRIRHEYKLLKASPSNEKEPGPSTDTHPTLRTLNSTSAITRHQLTMDLLDLWAPATALGLVNFNDGVVGIFGTITSIMSLQKQWSSLGGGK